MWKKPVETEGKQSPGAGMPAAGGLGASQTHSRDPHKCRAEVPRSPGAGAASKGMAIQTHARPKLINLFNITVSSCGYPLQSIKKSCG